MEPTPLSRMRSLLFAPAVRDDLIPKTLRTGADGIVIDCEDATPVSQKAAGRSNAADLAPTIMGHGSDIFVRVNPPGTPWFSDDISFGLHENLAGVVVPMVETLEGLDQCAKALAAADLGHLGIVAGLETARGVADARHLLAHGQVIGGYFGAEDYIADLGGVRTQNNIEVQFARASIAQASRLAQTPVIDQIVANFRDNDRMSARGLRGPCDGLRWQVVHSSRPGRSRQRRFHTHRGRDRTSRTAARRLRHRYCRWRSRD